MIKLDTRSNHTEYENLFLFSYSNEKSLLYEIFSNWNPLSLFIFIYLYIFVFNFLSLLFLVSFILNMDNYK